MATKNKLKIIRNFFLYWGIGFGISMIIVPVIDGQYLTRTLLSLVMFAMISPDFSILVFTETKCFLLRICEDIVNSLKDL